MPHQSARAAEAVPQLTFPPFLAWRVSADGRFVSAIGSAADEYAVASELLGQDFRAALADDPGAIARIERALSGIPVAEIHTSWGARWFTLASMGARGVDGWSVMLPEGAGEDPSSGQRRRTWEMEGVRSEAGGYRDGDVFVKVNGRPGVAMGRRISDEEFLALHMEHGSSVHLTSDSAPPRPVAAHLRLLR